MQGIVLLETHRISTQPILSGATIRAHHEGGLTVAHIPRVEDRFDLDEEITLAVKETLKFIEEVKELTYTDEQAKAIIKACATIMIDNL